jgi:hypothetical protein
VRIHTNGDVWNGGKNTSPKFEDVGIPYDVRVCIIATFERFVVLV